MSRLLERVETIGREFAQSLGASSHTFASLLEGSIDREVYAALLVQIFKIENVTGSIFHQFADALALAEYRPATPRPKERLCHPEDLVLSDLASIWHCNTDEAFARAYSSAWLPPVRLYAGTVETLLMHFAWALPAAAVVLDEWTRVARPAAARLEKRLPFPEATGSSRYLAGPSLRAEQIGTREIFDQVRVNDERAVLSAAQSTTDVLRFVFAHLGESI